MSWNWHCWKETRDRKSGRPAKSLMPEEQTEGPTSTKESGKPPKKWGPFEHNEQESRGLREADKNIGSRDWVTNLNDAIDVSHSEKGPLQAGEWHPCAELCNHRRGRHAGNSCTEGGNCHQQPISQRCNKGSMEESHRQKPGACNARDELRRKFQTPNLSQA